MKRVIWADDAVDDLYGIRAYLSQYGADTAQAHIDRLILVTYWLTDWPQAGRPVGGGWRKWKPRRARHLLLYRVVPDGIEIGRVRHEREDWLVDL